MEQSDNKFVFDNIKFACILTDLVTELTTRRYNAPDSLTRLYYKLAYMELRDITSLFSQTTPQNYKPQKVADIQATLDQLLRSFEAHRNKATTFELVLIYTVAIDKTKYALTAFSTAMSQELINE